MSLITDLLFPKVKYDFSSLTTKSVFQLNGFDGVLSIFPYHYPIKDIISDIKYNFVTDVIPELVDYSANSLINNFPNLLSYWQENKFTLIPVPLHEFRQNWRGFNQSELIGSSLATSLHLDYSNTLISRNRISSSQASQKDKLTRHSNIRNSFTLTSFPPPNIILFDDVITTGSTIKSLASIFPKNTCLWALSIAG